MQFTKSISLLAAVLATFAAAAPVPAPAAEAQVVQEGPGGHVFVQAKPAAAKVVTVTAGGSPAAPTQHPATSNNNAQQKQQPPKQQQQPAPSTPPQPTAPQSSQSSSSSPSTGSSSNTGGSGGLTIINKCSKAVKAQKFQGKDAAGHNSQVGGDQDIQPGSSGHFSMDGSAQVVKVAFEGQDPNSTGTEVEWDNSGFFDLSLLVGNPFLQYGQKLVGPSSCTSQYTKSNTVSCAPGVSQCPGSYYKNANGSDGPDGTIGCPALSQGLTYTLCEH